MIITKSFFRNHVILMLCSALAPVLVMVYEETVAYHRARHGRDLEVGSNETEMVASVGKDKDAEVQSPLSSSSNATAGEKSGRTNSWVEANPGAPATGGRGGQRAAGGDDL